MGSSSPPLLLPSFHPPSLSSFYTPPFPLLLHTPNLWGFYISVLHLIIFRIMCGTNWIWSYKTERKKKKKKSKELPKGNVTETGRKGKHWERKDGRKKWKRVSHFVLFQPGKMHHYTLGRDTDSDKESLTAKDVLNEPLPCAKSHAEKDRNSKHSFHQLNTFITPYFHKWCVWNSKS